MLQFPHLFFFPLPPPPPSGGPPCAWADRCQVPRGLLQCCQTGTVGCRQPAVDRGGERLTRSALRRTAADILRPTPLMGRAHRASLQEEDAALLEAVGELGLRWAQVAKKLGKMGYQRTDNGCLRRCVDTAAAHCCLAFLRLNLFLGFRDDLTLHRLFQPRLPAPCRAREARLRQPQAGQAGHVAL